MFLLLFLAACLLKYFLHALLMYAYPLLAHLLLDFLAMGLMKTVFQILFLILDLLLLVTRLQKSMFRATLVIFLSTYLYLLELPSNGRLCAMCFR